jgi:hypothetical protein
VKPARCCCMRTLHLFCVRVPLRAGISLRRPEGTAARMLRGARAACCRPATCNALIVGGVTGVHCTTEPAVSRWHIMIGNENKNQPA